MTCIIAMRDADIIHIAADRAISGETMVSNGGSKLVRFSSGLIVGFSGALATQNVMEFIPELSQCDLSNNSSIASLFNKFQGVAGFQLPGASPTEFWAIMLLAMKNKLIWMGNVGGWHSVPESVKAIGSGAHIALGSWFERSDLTPEARLKRAIEVASIHMPGVSKACDYDHT